MIIPNGEIRFRVTGRTHAALKIAIYNELAAFYGDAEHVECRWTASANSVDIEGYGEPDSTMVLGYTADVVAWLT